MQRFFVHELSSGIKLLFNEDQASVVTHCGVMIKTGTRDEPEGKEGLAHFIEHTLFKGTGKRKAFHILNHLEIVGGELNAYTTKEETCLHATVMNMHLERATELLADIALNANFPDKELQKEKEVIIDEIHAYEDMPYEQIYDDFEALVFKNHPLGHPILGTIDSVSSFSRQDTLNYFHDNYKSGEIIFAVSSNAPYEKVFRVAEKYFSPKNKFLNGERKKFTSVAPQHLTAIKKINQVHYITGCPAYPLSHRNRFTLLLLNNILGGPGMNSRLSLNIREKYGYTYSIESGYHAYSDAGLFNIYFATELKNFEKVKKLLEKEITRMLNPQMSERQFAQYKKQFIGQITIAQENRLNLLLSMAKSLLYFKKIFTLQEITAHIEKITLKEFMQVAQTILSNQKYSSLTYMPAKE